MTKIIKAWHKMSFWNFIGYIATPLAAIGEGAIIKFEGHWFFHVLVVTGFVTAGWIKFNIKDDDNNGIADRYEENIKQKK